MKSWAETETAQGFKSHLDEDKRLKVVYDEKNDQELFWILTKMKTFEPRARDAGRKPRIVCLDNEVEGDDEDAVEEGGEDDGEEEE